MISIVMSNYSWRISWSQLWCWEKSVQLTFTRGNTASCNPVFYGHFYKENWHWFTEEIFFKTRFYNVISDVTYFKNSKKITMESSKSVVQACKTTLCFPKNVVLSTLRLSWNQNHNVSGDRHWLHTFLYVAINPTTIRSRQRRPSRQFWIHIYKINQIQHSKTRLFRTNIHT